MRVLILDDIDQARRSLVWCFFDKHHCDCFEANNNNEAFDLLGERSFDLITTDFVRGSNDGGRWGGISFYRQLKADRRFSHLPVIVVSGNDENLPDFVEEVELAGDIVLTKPFFFWEVEGAVEKLREAGRLPVLSNESDGNRFFNALKQQDSDRRMPWYPFNTPPPLPPSREY